MHISSKTSPAANQVRPRDTSGPKLLDNSGRETLPALKLLDKSGPEVFGQVRPRDKSSPETSLAQKCLDKSGPEIFLILLSFFIKQKFQAPETSPALRHVGPRDISGTETFLSLIF